MRPIVVIAAVRSTGSTLLSEMLTELPRAFVFREPGLFGGRLVLKDADLDRLLAHGIDLRGVTQRRDRGDPVQRARAFREQVAASALDVAEQVGIKEIRYFGGTHTLDVLDELGDVRVVVLARDPRDIYISLAHKAQNGRVARVPGEFGPAAMLAEYRRDLAPQAALMDAVACLPVRYEDLCRDPAVIAEVRRFVGSPVTGDGEVGSFKPQHRELHGPAPTSLRVARHATEPDERIVAEAVEFARGLGDYCERWGYDI